MEVVCNTYDDNELNRRIDYNNKEKTEEQETKTDVPEIYVLRENSPTKRKLDQLNETDRKEEDKKEEKEKEEKEYEDLLSYIKEGQTKKAKKVTRMEELQKLIDEMPDDVRNHHALNIRESLKDAKSPIVLRIMYETYDMFFAWWPINERVGTLVLNTLYVTLADVSSDHDHHMLVEVITESMLQTPDKYEKKKLNEYLGTIDLGKMKKIYLGKAYEHTIYGEIYDENTSVSFYSLSPRLATYTYFAPPV